MRRLDFGDDGYVRLIRLPAYNGAQIVADPRRGFGQPIFARGGARLEDALAMFRAGEAPRCRGRRLPGAGRAARGRCSHRDSRRRLTVTLGHPRGLSELFLALAGQRGWAVLMKDARIRYRPAERAAFVANNVRAFCLTSGNLSASAMAEQYLAALETITDACAQPGPALHLISAGGTRQVPLD